MKALSYDTQLAWLTMRYLEAEGRAEKTMLLSLAQSVKEARDHNLNCPKGRQDENK